MRACVSRYTPPDLERYVSGCYALLNRDLFRGRLNRAVIAFYPEAFDGEAEPHTSYDPRTRTYFLNSRCLYANIQYTIASLVMDMTFAAFCAHRDTSFPPHDATWLPTLQRIGFLFHWNEHLGDYWGNNRWRCRGVANPLISLLRSYGMDARAWQNGWPDDTCPVHEN